MAFQVQHARDVPGVLTEIIEVIDRVRLRTLAPGEAANWLERLLAEADHLTPDDLTAARQALHAVRELAGTLHTAEAQALDAANLCRTARRGR
jgi:hypothetical protein